MDIWDFLKQNSDALGVAAVIGLVGGVFRWLFKSHKESKNDSESGVPLNVNQGSNIYVNVNQGNNISLTSEILQQIIKNAEDAKTVELKNVHNDEKERLLKEINELETRRVNPEKALKEANEAIAKLESALEDESSALGEEKINNAKAALEKGDFSLADALFAEIETKEQSAVERVARSAFTRGEIAEQQVRWADAAKHYAKVARLQPNYEHLLKAQDFAEKAGDYATSVKLGSALEKAAIDEGGENSIEHGRALNAYATALYSSGDYKTAETLYKKALAIRKKILGEEHLDYAISLNNLALLYESQGRYDEAEPLYQQALAIDKKVLGEEHPDYAIHLNNLAALYYSQGRYDEAEPLFQQALAIRKKVLGEEHPDYAIGLNNLASIHKLQGHYEEAEPLFKQALAIDKKVLGEEHPGYATGLNNLAGLYKSQGRYDEAEPLLKQAIEIFEAALGAEHPDTKQTKDNYEIFQESRP